MMPHAYARMLRKQNSGSLTFAFKVTLLAAESQGAQEGKTTDGDERDSDGSSGNSGTAETSVRDGSLDGAIIQCKTKSILTTM